MTQRDSWCTYTMCGRNVTNILWCLSSWNVPTIYSTTYICSTRKIYWVTLCFECIWGFLIICIRSQASLSDCVKTLSLPSQTMNCSAKFTVHLGFHLVGGAHFQFLVFPNHLGAHNVACSFTYLFKLRSVSMWLQLVTFPVITGPPIRHVSSPQHCYKMKHNVWTH